MLRFRIWLLGSIFQKLTLFLFKETLQTEVYQESFTSLV